MMRTKLTLVAASLAALMMTTAHAAPTPVKADLSISAKVVPSACNLDFTNNGIVDYGDIPSSTLSTSNATLLQTKSLNYAINCNLPTTVSFSVIDNRANTQTADISHPSYSFGLGQQDGVNIGSNQYLFLKAGLMVDGAQGTFTYTNNGTYWYTGSSVTPLSTTPGYKYGFVHSDVGNNYQLPAEAITTVSGTIEAKTNIAPSSSLDLSKIVNIDGFATLQLHYI